MPIERLLYGLGVKEFLFYDWSGLGVLIVDRSSSVRVENIGETLVVNTEAGRFFVDSASLELRAWDVDGQDVRVVLFEDEQLSLLASTFSDKSDSVNLMIDGIPYFNPLFCAAAYERTRVMRSLLDAGASDEPEGPGRLNALHAAASFSRQESSHLLLEAGMMIDSTTVDGVTPLIAAVTPPAGASSLLRLDTASGTKSGATSTLSLFLRVDSYQTDPLAQMNNGETVLFGAARSGMTRLIDRLLDAGLHSNIENDAGETALFAAVWADNPESLQMLVRRGARWNGKNNQGQTPLRIALAQHHDRCVGVIKWHAPFHWSTGAAIHYSKSTELGYEAAPGAGGFIDLHLHLLKLFWLSGECGYTVRGTYAPPDDIWLVSTFGSPYYEYQHLDLSLLLNVAVMGGHGWRLSLIAGGDYRLQTSAVIRTDSNDWDPIELDDTLKSSGLGFTLGLGLNGFSGLGGMLAGAELRYSHTIDGSWTSRGGGLDSWALLVRFGL